MAQYNKKSVSDDLSIQSLVRNYGSVFESTGGANKSQVGGLKIASFVKKISDNRVLDLYLKYVGVTTLSTGTLVPLALIMGRDVFKWVVNNIINEKKTKQQKGGALLKNKIPVLDDALIGNYLKIAGLTAMSLSPATLVPVGILMVMYDLYYKNQTGGSIFPLKYMKNSMEGGNVQWKMNPAPYPNYNSSKDGLLSQTIGVDGINESTPPADVNIDILGHGYQSGGGSDWRSTQMSRGAANAPDMNPNQFKAFTTTAEYIGNTELANGAANHWIGGNADGGNGNHSTLHELNPHNGPPTGTRPNGIPTQLFGGGDANQSANDLGPNELFPDRRQGYADVSTSSGLVQSAIGGGNKDPTETDVLFKNFLNQNGGFSDDDILKKEMMIGGGEDDIDAIDTKILFKKFMKQTGQSGGAMSEPIVSEVEGMTGGSLLTNMVDNFKKNVDSVKNAVSPTTDNVPAENSEPFTNLLSGGGTNPGDTNTVQLFENFLDETKHLSGGDMDEISNRSTVRSLMDGGSNDNVSIMSNGSRNVRKSVDRKYNQLKKKYHY